MALAELAELQTQPLPTPLSPQDACSSRWPSREGATPPKKAPAQLQGVRAEGSGLWETFAWSGLSWPTR